MVDDFNDESSQAITDGNSLTLFVDTNFFLQLKPPGDLPWKAVSQHRCLNLVVPRAVQKELSRLKADGNHRRAKRARAAVQLLMKIAQSVDNREVVHESGPRVQIRLPSPAVLSPHPSLDPNKPDDQIIAEVLEFAKANPGADVAFLTMDSDQVMNCKFFKVTFIAVPLDWHLPHEPDERDKRISDLQRRLTHLEATEPKIGFHWRSTDDNLIDTFAVTIDDYSDVTADSIDELMAEVRRRRPPAEGLDELIGATSPRNMIDKTRLAAVPFSRFDPITQEQVTKYRENEYPGWLARVRKCFETLPKRMGCSSRSGKLIGVLSNNGARPAEGAIVTMTAFGGILFGQKTSAPGSEDALPQPPKPPQGSVVRRSGSMESMMDTFRRSSLDEQMIARMRPDAVHDPCAFYLIEGDRNRRSHRWAFKCDEFRHDGYEETFEIPVLFPCGSKPVNPAIGCEIFARNMSAPVKLTLPVKIVRNQFDSLVAARELLDQHFRIEPQISFDL